MTTQPAKTRFLHPSPYGYSNVVEITGGRLVFITGQVARDSSGNLVGPNDFRAQVQQVFENLQTELAAVGADFSHVIKLMVLADAEAFPVQMHVYGEVRDHYVNRDNPPASGVILAPKLIPEGALIDITAIAHVLE
jgi:enamine deaminase RidA (YjgF/YER057c/UK114 family)